MALNEAQSASTRGEDRGGEGERKQQAVIRNWPTEGAVDSGQCAAAAAAQPFEGVSSCVNMIYSTKSYFTVIFFKS